MIRSDSSDDVAQDNILLARKLAKMSPSSLSIDNLAALCKPSPKKQNQHRVYIPPNPSVTVIKDEDEPQPEKKPAPSRFANLIKASKQQPPKQPSQVTKIKYDLPNVKKLTMNKNTAVMAVSFSSPDLCEQSPEA